MRRNLDIVDALFEQYKSLQPLKKEDQERLDKKFRLEFNYNSNHLEGNTLTYSETELLLIFDDTKGSHTMRELEEMKAHDVAYQLIEDWAKDVDRPLTEQHIKNLNEIILVRPYWKDATTPDGQRTRRQIKVGDYKEHPNSVLLQNGEIFHYASPSETPIQMGELIEWYRESEEGENIIVLAAMLHYKFVRIHPFDDGNGRISRLLMNYVFLKNGYTPIVIKSADKPNYLRALHLADIGDFEPFIDYIAEQVIWSLELAVKAARGESIDEPKDWEKKLEVFKRSSGYGKKVDIIYNIDSFKSVVENTIKPLASEWEIKWQQFDPLFFTRVVTVIIGNTTKEGSDIFDTLSDVIDEVVYDHNPTSIGIDRIYIWCLFHRLRSSTEPSAINGGEIEFLFHRNAYEVKMININKDVSKLYGEDLLENERAEIVDLMGSWLFENIEKENKT